MILRYLTWNMDTLSASSWLIELGQDTVYNKDIDMRDFETIETMIALKVRYLFTDGMSRMTHYFFEGTSLSQDGAQCAASDLKKGKFDAVVFWFKLNFKGTLGGTPGNVKDVYDFIKHYDDRFWSILPPWPIDLHKAVIELYGISDFHAGLFVQNLKQGNPGAKKLLKDMVESGVFGKNTILECRLDFTHYS